MIKVEFIRKEDDTVDLIFESRTVDNDSLAELDYLYEILMRACSHTVLNGGYLNSSRFSITLNNMV